MSEPKEAKIRLLLETLIKDPKYLERCLSLVEPVALDKLETSSQWAKVFWPLLGAWEEERCAVVAVDNHNRLIDATILTMGSHRLVVIDVPHVLRWVLTRKRPAAGFAIGHNHPDGNPAPSKEDREITKLLQKGADAVGLDFIDHMIVGSSTRWYSFEDNEGSIEQITTVRPRVVREPRKVS